MALLWFQPGQLQHTQAPVMCSRSEQLSRTLE